MRRAIQRASSFGPPYQQAGPNATFVCSRCRHQAIQAQAIRASSVQQLRYFAERKLPIDPDKWRQKIWGTQQPPGPKDPYTDRQTEAPEEVATDSVPTVPAPAASESAAAPENVELESLPAQELYDPAKTWDGLERIGGPSGWWEDAWDQEHQFQGFIPSVKIAEVDMEGAVRRAVVEILALKEASRPLTDSTNALQHTTFDYSHVDLDINNGTPTLRFEDDSIRSELLDSMPSEVKFEERAAPATAGYDAEEHNRVTNHGEEEAFDPNAHGWYGISLDDGHFKFALLKRVMQLTGARIPDPVIRSVHTVGNLLEQVLKKPQPKKLAEVLLARSDLIALPNVEIFETRHSYIDKEKEIGRWKVIEDELESRGLPVTGPSHEAR